MLKHTEFGMSLNRVAEELRQGLLAPLKSDLEKEDYYLQVETVLSGQQLLGFGYYD